MTASLRVVDTGVNSARRNVAVTAALSELHRAGRLDDTLRFHHYPASVLIGRHQVAAHAVNLPRCRRREIELARRVTGGGAVYMAPGILAFDLVLSRRAFGGGQLGEASAVICGAVAAGLSRLGLPARYRPRNEIEIGGRKVSGASVYFDGPTLVYQGTILLDAPLEDMADVLALPAAKGQRLAALRDRLTGVASFLGRMPDPGEVEAVLSSTIALVLRREVTSDPLGPEVDRLAAQLHDREIGTEAFVLGDEPVQSGSALVGRQKASSGTIEAHIRVAPGAGRLIEQIWLTGDFSVVPARAIPDIEAALRGLPVASAASRAVEILADDQVRLHGATRFDVAAAIANAAKIGVSAARGAP